MARGHWGNRNRIGCDGRDGQSAIGRLIGERIGSREVSIGNVGKAYHRSAASRIRGCGRGDQRGGQRRALRRIYVVAKDTAGGNGDGQGLVFRGGIRIRNRVDIRAKGDRNRDSGSRRRQCLIIGCIGERIRSCKATLLEYM